MPKAFKRPDHRYTYKDYLTWPDDERWELIEGIAYDMTPAPSPIHQEVCMALGSILYAYFKTTQCKVYPAPFDVRLPQTGEADEEARTVVQPDISVICDSNKVDERGCKGSPDLVIEVTSPSTRRKDIKEKYYLYERFGVKEYWIVYPEEKIVTIFRLTTEGKYGRPEVYAPPDKISLVQFPELVVELEQIFTT